MDVGESDEGDDMVGDDVKSEKLGPRGCRYVRISISVGLVLRVCVRLVRVRVRELRVAGMPRHLRSVHLSRDSR